MISHRRWLEAFIFLGLDLIQAFHKDLWLAALDMKSIQKILRENSLPCFTEDKDYADRITIISADFCLKVRKELTKEQFFQLAWWVRNVFLVNGQDRSSETAWRTIVYKSTSN